MECDNCLGVVALVGYDMDIRSRAVEVRFRLYFLELVNLGHLVKCGLSDIIATRGIHILRIG